MVASYVYDLSHYGRPLAWLLNVGGAGSQDLLLVLPLLAGAVWIALTAYARLRAHFAAPPAEAASCV
ncbi:hypothetical protein [Ramlibacter alkalitolerans]|uniref:Uncharacterized protein n=1 Tax=Ramlibacter alkalitolerans TaxID=2039631 RepID=A0ABS1JTZ9_9BURK|nr:hypothetical protein [Ramlibacter alkalitolerans]MBL0427692.1 hypothetical protein [Ramlibacter alkalitolerans]